MGPIHLLETISNTADGVFAVDVDQRIIHWNAGAEKILGYSAEEMLGRFCFELFKGVDGSSRQVCYLGCPVIDCAKAGYPTPGHDVKIKAKDGTRRWLSMVHTYIRNQNGEGEYGRLVAMIHIFRDATEVMEAKHTLERISREVSAYGNSAAVKVPEIHDHDELTEREKQVVTMLAQGEGTSDIAKKLTISNTTARNHIQSVLVKLNVHTRLEAVAHVLRNRVIDRE